MFQRYTESARRTIFYARYEASNYGSSYIETEHLLLGLLRECRSLTKWFPGQTNVEPQIRAEIEKLIVRGERISTSIEMPLSAESKRVLTLATDTCDSLGHSHVEPEHLLIGILRVETSLAAQILMQRGLKPEPIQAQLASPKHQSKAPTDPSIVLDSFLAGLKGRRSAELFPFFAANAEFIDVSGKRWNRDEICQHSEELFAPYAKKNATYAVESSTPWRTWLGFLDHFRTSCK